MAVISKYTRAKLFSKVGNSCETFARFSVMAGEMGSPDTARDPRGFARKFYTEDGNWDVAMSMISTYGKYRRDRQAAAPVYPIPTHQVRCELMHALAMIGLGLGGVAAMDDDEALGIG